MTHGGMLALLFLMAAVFMARAEEKSFRLGIYTPHCPELGAALTAAFSNKLEFELVEREELGRLVNEQKLAGLSSSGVYQGADKLLGANYLIWIEPREVMAPNSGRQQKMAPVQIPSMRLIDCKTGGLLSWVEVPQSLDTAQAAQWLATRVMLQMEKAKNPATQKISLLGLRCELVTSETPLLERELNVALSMELQANPRSLVLERWRLNDLVFEKEMNRQIDSPFWTASILVDGSIAKSGNELVVRVRVRRAGDEPGRVIECRGTKTDIRPLIQALQQAILGNDKNQQTPLVTWDAEIEAAFFEKEANWLMDHHLPRQAVQAMESACALGPLERRREMLRIKAYTMCAFPDEFELKTSSDPYDGRELTEQNIPEAISYASQMSQLMVDYLGHFRNRSDFERGGPTFQDPGVLGQRSLITLFHVMRAAHEQGFKVKASGALRDLRQLARQIIGEIESAHLHYIRNDFFKTLTLYAAYWNEDPASTILFYKRVLARDFDGALKADGIWAAHFREALGGDNGFHPPLIQGEMPDKKFSPHDLKTYRVINWAGNGSDLAANQTWSNYVNGLRSSPDPLDQADGWFFRWAALPTMEDRLVAAPEALAFLRSQRALLSGSLSGAIFNYFSEPIQLAATTPALRDEQEKLVDLYVDLFQEKKQLNWIALIKLGWIIPAESRGSNSTEEQARRLLTAIDLHESVVNPIDDRYRVFLNGARQVLFTRFPNLRPQDSSMPALTVNRLWTSVRYCPEWRRFVMFDPVVWAEGKIWFWGKGVGRIDLSTFAMEKVPTHSDKYRFSNGYEAPLIVLRDKAFIATQQGVAQLDRATGLWTPLALPPSSYRLYLANDALWAAFGHTPNAIDNMPDQGTGLYRIDPSNGAAELIFSTHRQPAAHPLDSMPAGIPFALFSGTDGWPIMGVNDAKQDPTYVNTHTGERWDKFPSLRGTKARSTSEGTILTPGRSSRGALGCVGWVNSSGHYEVLLWNPNIKLSPNVPPDWAMPEELAANSEHSGRGFSVSMNKSDLYILATNSGSYTKGLSALSLYYFRRNEPRPVIIPLKLEITDTDRKLLESEPFYLIDRAIKPTCADHDLTATEEGLVITGFGLDGFWFIPKSDIDSHIQRLPKK